VRSKNDFHVNVAARLAVLVTLLLPILPTSVAAEPDPGDAEGSRVIRAQRTAPVTPFVIDIDLRDLPAPREWQPGDPIRDVPKRRYLTPGTVLPAPIEIRDPLLDRQLEFSGGGALRGVSGFTAPTENFGGIAFTGAGVPDTIGDVGLDHIIQATNGGGSRIQIWEKATSPPSLVSTFTLDSLGTGPCVNGLGDPVVIYDRNADRWVLLEFVSGGNDLCVYVSQTADPVSGGWYAYDFVPPSFPDYPKLAVWPTDANQGDGSYVVTANAGVAVYAMERGEMLAGEPASFQIYDLPNLSGFSFQSATPADIDGPTPPPAGAPAVIMRHRDTEVHSGLAAPEDLLEMWALDVDWADSGNSTLTPLPAIDVAEFSSDLCGLVSFSCIEQPDSSVTLDPLREVIMHRLQYIHHDDGFETLVGNFVVDVSGTDQGGIRWFELRRTGGVSGSWTLHQEGTYSIDSDSRWMGASSMDRSGNIALGYNVSSTGTYPSLRYTGRKMDDPLGVMTAPETPIVDGSSHSGTNRYGDYAAMGLDPSDDCTFWFTGEYNVATTWSTRWVSFAFDQCGCLIDNFPVPSLGATADDLNRVDLTWTDPPEPTVVEYVVRRSLTPGGPYETIAVVADSSPGAGGGPDYGYADLDVSGGLVYYYVVLASDGESCRSDAVNEVAAFPFGRCLLRPIFDGVVNAQIDLDSTCGIQLDWSPATPQCGSGVLYTLYRSTDPGFTPGPDSLVAGGIDGTSALDQNGLTSGAEYFYTVRAVDTFNHREDLNEVKASAVAGGAGGQSTHFFEDFEDAAAFASWTVTEGPGVHRCGEWDLSTNASRRPAAGSGQYVIANSFDCSEFAALTSASVDSPPIDLSSPALAAVVLDVDLLYDHNGGETGTIEVWDGSQWVVIWQDPNSDVNTSLSFDVSAWALGNAAFQIRFSYQGGNFDRWFSVDDVRIGVDLTCSTAPSPNPAPSGVAPTNPLRAERLTTAGDSIDVTWDAATCGSGVYNLLYGDLANVGNYALSGGECGVGNAGSFSWTGVPAGDLFFLIVGGDGVVTESSWGQSTFGERNGLSPSGECGATSKNVTATCPAN
jgi:hypothetical protein